MGPNLCCLWIIFHPDAHLWVAPLVCTTTGEPRKGFPFSGRCNRGPPRISHTRRLLRCSSLHRRLRSAYARRSQRGLRVNNRCFCCLGRGGSSPSPRSILVCRMSLRMDVRDLGLVGPNVSLSNHHASQNLLLLLLLGRRCRRRNLPLTGGWDAVRGGSTH